MEEKVTQRSGPLPKSRFPWPCGLTMVPVPSSVPHKIRDQRLTAALHSYASGVDAAFRDRIRA